MLEDIWRENAEGGRGDSHGHSLEWLAGGWEERRGMEAGFKRGGQREVGEAEWDSWMVRARREGG